MWPTSRWTPFAARCARGDTAIALKPKEYALLEFLMRNSDRPVTKALIIEHVWDIHFDSISNVVEVHINSLRNKIDRGFERRAHSHRARGRLRAHGHAVVTLTLRARLAAISTIVFGLLLAALSILSYGVLARRLDSDVTERLIQLTDGLHGYLRFDGGVPWVDFDATDSDQATFVHEATRYYQIYDLPTGRLLAESTGLAPLGLRLTSTEVRAFRAQPKPFDIATEYGRLRISNSVRTMPDGQAYLLQVGVSLAAMDDALRRYRGLLLLYAPAALLIAMFAAWWLSGFALAPLSRMADEARRDRRARRSSGGFRCAAWTMNWIRWRRPSTVRSPGSKRRSARCVSSAPRSRTSCARR